MEAEQIVQMVIDFIRETGNAVVQTGFPIAVKYVVATGITKVVSGSIGLVLFASAIFNWIKIARIADIEENEDLFNSNSQALVAIVLTVLGILGGFSMAFNLFDGIRMLISPEWYAILNIIHLVK